MAQPQQRAPSRRGILAATGAMLGGLTAGYGGLLAIAGRYLMPVRRQETAVLFVARVEDIAVGDSLGYESPFGQRVVITRQSAGQGVGDFLALSNVCPHLGCQVHWEAQGERFVCPCHQGVFDRQGGPVSGPPAQAGQSLPRYPLRVERGLLFIEVPSGELALRGSGGRRDHRPEVAAV